jgi:hypothetical protein
MASARSSQKTTCRGELLSRARQAGQERHADGPVAVVLFRDTDIAGVAVRAAPLRHSSQADEAVAPQSKLNRFYFLRVSGGGETNGGGLDRGTLPGTKKSRRSSDPFRSRLSARRLIHI